MVEFDYLYGEEKGNYEKPSVKSLNVMLHVRYVLMLSCHTQITAAMPVQAAEHAATLVLSFSSLVPPLQDDLRDPFVFVSHSVHLSEGRQTYGNDAQTGLGKWSDSCELQSRWTDVPFTELNVIGWHFPACLMDKAAGNGPERGGKARLVQQRSGKDSLGGCDKTLESSIVFIRH